MSCCFLFGALKTMARLPEFSSVSHQPVAFSAVLALDLDSYSSTVLGPDLLRDFWSCCSSHPFLFWCHRDLCSISCCCLPATIGRRKARFALHDNKVNKTSQKHKFGNANGDLFVTDGKAKARTVVTRMSFLLSSSRCLDSASFSSSSNIVFSFSTSDNCSSAIDRASCSESAFANASCNCAPIESLQEVHKDK